MNLATTLLFALFVLAGALRGRRRSPGHLGRTTPLPDPGYSRYTEDTRTFFQLLPTATEADVTTLARIITSETGDQTAAERQAIGWAARNRALLQKKTISALACSPCGPQGKGRPFSTRRKGTASSRMLARAILLAPQSADPTNGTTDMWEPALMARLHLEKQAPNTPAILRQRRSRWGMPHVRSVGRWEMYRNNRLFKRFR